MPISSPFPPSETPNFPNQPQHSAPLRVVAFGEILWDMLPAGKKLGGAPVNFLYHSQTLGAEVRPLTRIGADELGREIRAVLDKLGFSPETLSTLQTSPTAPTGTVAVTLDANGSPSYEIVKNVAWDEIAVDDATEAAIVRFLTEKSAAIPSFFYFGSLALRSETNRRSLAQILAALPPSVVRVCDLNLRAPFFSREIIELALTDADVFKLNDAEATLLDEMLTDADFPSVLRRFAAEDGSLGTDDSPEFRAALRDWATRLRRRFDLKTLVLTLGSRGAFLFDGAETAFSPSFPVEPKDSVGAGDAFSAVCLVGLARKLPAEKIVSAASRRAAFVCSREGATPPIPPELSDAFELD